MMNKPENTTDWETRPSEVNTGWTAVGYIMKGPHHGTFVPCHHWGDRRDAVAHAAVLNRGLSRDAARDHVLALVHVEEPRV